MRNKAMMILFLLAFAAPIFAQGTAQSAVGEHGLLLPAFAMAIAAGLCGRAQGQAIASAAEGIARNPGAAGKIQTLLLIGLAFIESLALFTFVKVG
ncbi:ATP synthase F0 subunit C [Bryobacter aggregatus]|uniref:ATP synthase F0 subunit C n=1 Tax=Bryobacter aggregatus TaxID=360054 RepID=UPI0004E193E1|nr:ATP synthase F0 subunit C [Bryobacter aggregatus]